MDSGRVLKHMGMESTSGQMETDTKENGTCSKNQAKVLRVSPTVIPIVVNTRKELHTGLEHINGEMARSMLETL